MGDREVDRWRDRLIDPRCSQIALQVILDEKPLMVYNDILLQKFDPEALQNFIIH